MVPGLILLAACGGSEKQPPPRVAAEDPAAGPSGSPAGRYVGSETCARCHRPEHEAWAASWHRKTLVPVSAGAPSRLSGLPATGGFAVRADGTATGPANDGGETSAVAAYRIGGKHREDLWVRMADGRLQVFPVSFDVDRGEPFEPLRVLGGGAEPPPDTIDFWTRIGRSADLVCFGCHATGSRIEIGTAPPGGWAVPRSRWSEAGVGCEACHGPGGPHVDAAAAGRPSTSSIRGIRKGIPAEALAAACSACHGLRERLESPFGAFSTQAAGTPVWDRADPAQRVPENAEFRAPFFPDLRPATYQQEAIALGQSGCLLRGGLGCPHCHDPHSGALNARVSRGEACLPCHEKTAARLADHSRHGPGTPGGRCEDCHMAGILRGPGAAPARDHTLCPPVARPGEVPAACASCHASGKDAPAVVREWSRWPSNSAETRRRLSIREALESATAGETSARPRLASLASDPRQGWFLRTALLQRIGDSPRPAREGRAAAAASVSLGDANPAVRRAAARALAASGTSADLPRLAALANSPDPFLALEAVQAMGALGAPDARLRLEDLARRPDLAGEFRAQAAVARAAFLARDWRAAELAFRRALELHPFQITVMNDLGIALVNQERVAEAREIWSRALDLNPRLEAARRNLEEIRSLAPPTQ